MSSQERSSRQPTGQHRTKPGRKGEGDYFHVVVRDKNQFEKFRTQDVGHNGHSLRVAGQRPNGNWQTVKWLIAKSDATIVNGYLHGTRDKTRKLLSQFHYVPRHVTGDIFRTKV